MFTGSTFFCRFNSLKLCFWFCKSILLFRFLCWWVYYYHYADKRPGLIFLKTTTAVFSSSVIGLFFYNHRLGGITCFYQLQGFVFATGALVYINAIFFCQVPLPWYFNQSFVQRQLHFLQHLIDTLLSVSIGQVAVGSYFGEPLG